MGRIQSGLLERRQLFGRRKLSSDSHPADSHDTQTSDSADGHHSSGNDSHTDDSAHEHNSGSDDSHNSDSAHEHDDSHHNESEEESRSFEPENFGESFDSALEGSPNAEPMNLPVPTSPPDMNDVGDKLNQVTDQIDKIPGVGFIRSENGLFGDLFSKEHEPVHDEHEGMDYVTSADHGHGTENVPPNVEPFLAIDLTQNQSLEQSYMGIASELRVYQEAYIECLDKLSDLDFSQPNIDKCVGKGLRFVLDDADYFKLRILARVDSIVQSEMIESCFKVAGVDLVFSSACDLLQKDALNLLWSELNYHALIDYHRNKYTFRDAMLPQETLDNIVAQLEPLYKKQVDLLVETHNHKTLTLQRIKDYIADRFEYIRDEEAEDGPIQRKPLSSHKIIKIDGLSNKLKSLDQIRADNPEVMFKAARKTQQSEPTDAPFKSPWVNHDNRQYGRSAFEPSARQKGLVRIAQSIEEKINKSL